MERRESAIRENPLIKDISSEQGQPYPLSTYHVDKNYSKVCKIKLSGVRKGPE